MRKSLALRIITWCLYAMVLFVPVVFWQRTMFPFIIVKVALFQGLAEIIIFLWVVLAILDKKYRPRLTPLTAALGLLFVSLSVSSYFGMDFYASLWSTQARALGLLAMLHFILLYVALSALAQEIRWRAVWRVSLFASIYAAVAALLIPVSVTIQYLFLSKFQQVDITRPSSTFGNPTFLAGYLLFNVFLGLLLYLKEEKFWKWFGAGAALVSALGVLRTQTRGDILGMGAGFMLLIFLFALRKMRPWSFRESVARNPWLLTLVVLFVLGAGFIFTRSSAVWQSIPGVDRIARLNVMSADVFENRLLAWRGAWHAFLDKPVLGWGWENFNLAFQKYYDPKLLVSTFDETYWDKPHSILVEYAISGGIAGFLLYLALWVVFFYEVMKADMSKTAKAVFAAMFAAYLVQNLVIFDTIGTYLMAFIAMAYVNSVFPRGENTGTEQKRHEGDAPSAFLWAGLASGVVLAYFLNFQMVVAAHDEYGGPNYYLAGFPDQSVAAFDAAIAVPNPYRDAARINFAGVVKQGFEHVAGFSNIKDLQRRAKSEVEKVIAEHPHNYFYYTFLAEYENAFYKFDPGYLVDAEQLEAKALALSPKRQQVYYVIAKTELLKGNFDAGYQAFQTAVDLNPEAGDPHFYFGLLAFQKGDAKKGLEEIALAKQYGRVPRDAEEALALGDLYGDVAGDYTAAAKYYDTAIAFATGREDNAVLATNAKIKKALALYLDNQPAESKAVFEELKAERVDFTKINIGDQLPAIFQAIGFTP